MAILRRVFFIEKLCNFELHNGCCWMKFFAIRKHWWRERERGRWVFPWKNYLALTDISNAAAAVLIYLYNQNILICCFCILFIGNPINNVIKRQKMKSVCFFNVFIDILSSACTFFGMQNEWDVETAKKYLELNNILESGWISMMNR